MEKLTTYTETTQDAPAATGTQTDPGAQSHTQGTPGAQAETTTPGTQDAPAQSGPTFASLGVDSPICEALSALGIESAFPIQALALPVALAGHDVIGQARTGTGKTLAFGIPLLQHLGEDGTRRPNAPASLVVVPTRELAIQVADDLHAAGARSGTRVLTLYGGRAYEPQIEALRATVDVVVGTPGRLLDLARQRHLDLSDVRALVLDEADKMLDLGFLPDVERILQLTPTERQTMLFSATMPGEVVTLARRYLRQPMHVRAEGGDEPVHVPLTRQHVFRAHQLDKTEMLARILQAEGRGLTMVFCRTKRTADQLSGALATRGFAAAAVHGDLGQAQRERALRAFRHGKVDVLVATDVAARGLDVDDVTHVVNFECPDDEKAYLHRIGRTGRAGRSGVAVTFVDWSDLQRWKIIDNALGLGLAEPPETYSTSAHLYSALGIPDQANGHLPRARRERAGLEAEEIEDLGETGHGGSLRSPRRGGPHGRGASRGRGGTERGRDGRGPRRGAGGHREATVPGSDESGTADERPPRRRRIRRRTRGGVAAAASNDAGGMSASAETARSSGREAAGPGRFDGAETTGQEHPQGSPRRRHRSRRSRTTPGPQPETA